MQENGVCGYIKECDAYGLEEMMQKEEPYICLLVRANHEEFEGYGAESSICHLIFLLRGSKLGKDWFWRSSNEQLIIIKIVVKTGFNTRKQSRI